jgi:hypothetical protein
MVNGAISNAALPASSALLLKQHAEESAIPLFFSQVTRYSAVRKKLFRALA